jgi:hypothetical protein
MSLALKVSIKSSRTSIALSIATFSFEEPKLIDDVIKKMREIIIFIDLIIDSCLI